MLFSCGVLFFVVLWCLPSWFLLVLVSWFSVSHFYVYLCWFVAVFFVVFCLFVWPLLLLIVVFVVVAVVVVSQQYAEIILRTTSATVKFAREQQ